MKELIDITVCIVNWNTSQLLHDCLVSIYRYVWQASLQVIVVDNCSQDNSVEMVRLNFPEVQMVTNTENVGFARANNQAFKMASGRYVLMLNSDTLVEPDAFDTMLTFMDQHTEAGAMGCKLLNADRTLQRSCWRGFPSLQMAAVDAFYLWKLMPRLPWVRGVEISKQELDQVIQVDHLLGACILARRDMIEQIGGMDESIFLFYEETEWCYRIIKSGWKIYYVPTAQIVHLGQRSANLNPERNLPEKYRNYKWFFNKCMSGSPMEGDALKAIFVAAGLIRIGLWKFRGFNPIKREFAKRMRRGYWKVVKESLGLSSTTPQNSYIEKKPINQAQLPSL